MRIPRVTFNLVELSLLAGLIVVLAYAGGSYRTGMRLRPFLAPSAGELDALSRRYGSALNSEHGEEWIIRDFFQDLREGVFVDVGANHFQRQSNTYYLETELGWSGVAVEPQTKFAADYATHRPRTRFVPMFVSDTSNERVALIVPENNDLIASATKEFVESHGGRDLKTEEVKTTTLDDILDAAGIRHIDFMSIDIELHEPEALKGFSIDRFKPGLICIEAHPEVRQQILDYFTAHGYVPVGKYLRADGANLWFMPAGARAPTLEPSQTGSHSH